MNKTVITTYCFALFFALTAISAHALDSSVNDIQQQTLPARIIILNGATCVGKSSLAQELVAQLSNNGLKVAHFSVDDYFLEQFGSDSKINETKELERKYNLSFADAYFWNYHKKIVNKSLEVNVDVCIVEHCFFSNEYYFNFLFFWDFLNGLFPNRVSTLLIKVHCSKRIALEHLIQRNSYPDQAQHRGEGFLENHFNHLHRLHGNKQYYSEIDTEDKNPKELAFLVIRDLFDKTRKDRILKLSDLREHYEEINRRYATAKAFGIHLFN